MSDFPYLTAYIKQAAQNGSLPSLKEPAVGDTPGGSPPVTATPGGAPAGGTGVGSAQKVSQPGAGTAQPPTALAPPPSAPNPTVSNPQAGAPGAGLGSDMGSGPAGGPSAPGMGQIKMASLQSADDFVSAVTTGGRMQGDDLLSQWEKDSQPASWSSPTSIEGGDVEGRSVPSSLGPPTDIKIAEAYKAAFIPPGASKLVTKPLASAASKLFSGVKGLFSAGSKAGKGSSAMDVAGRVADVGGLGAGVHDIKNPASSFTAAARERMGI